jgi:hypothetical protein
MKSQIFRWIQIQNKNILEGLSGAQTEKKFVSGFLYLGLIVLPRAIFWSSVPLKALEKIFSSNNISKYSGAITNYAE